MNVAARVSAARAWVRSRPRDGRLRAHYKAWALTKYVARHTWLLPRSVYADWCWLTQPHSREQAIDVWRYRQLNHRHRRAARRIVRRSARRHAYARRLYNSIASPVGMGNDGQKAYDLATRTWFGTLVGNMLGAGQPFYDVTNPSLAGGAQGNGIADDFGAISAALQQGIAFLPPHRTYFTSQTISVGQQTLIWGAGWSAILTSSTASPILQMVTTTADHEVKGCNLINFRVDGTTPGTGLTGFLAVPPVIGQGARTSRTSYIDQLQFTNCNVGAHLVFTQGFGIRDSKFGGTGAGALGNNIGLYISDNAQLGRVDNCDFRDNIQIGYLLEASNTIITTTNDRIYSWTFAGVHCEINLGKGTVFDGATYNTCVGCKWEQNADDAVTLQSTVSTFRCDSNTWIGGIFNGSPATPTKYQVNLQASSNTTFINVFFNANSTGGFLNDVGAIWTLFINCANGPLITDNAGTAIQGAGASFLTPGRNVGFAGHVVALVDAANIAVDTTKGGVFKVTLTANRTMSIPSQAKDGGRITFYVYQDGVGAHTLGWTGGNGGYNHAWSDVGNAASKKSSISFIYDVTQQRWTQDGAQSPYF